ncbi:MAG: aspartate kinase [Peptococcaceae bacterium]|nr:aspartate kinase [Peptococcaceae bacterium]
MKILVQKFGGTSVADPDRRAQAAAKIIAAKDAGFSPVVVVSAIGRNGDPYATDTFLNLVKGINHDIPRRELDILMSCGEVISGSVMVTSLLALGYEAVLLTGAQAGIITTNTFGDARIIRIEPKNILANLAQDKIVVVAGFQGVTEDGDITTLGRGGSDTTASALGVALNAEAIEIYTDVEGIMTADPRLVENARILDVVTYNEIVQLAYQGAKVIHPRAVEIAAQRNIPLWVKSTFSDASGTLVTNQVDSDTMEAHTDITSDRLITGIAHTPNVSQLWLNVDPAKHTPEFNLKIFAAMALADISVDFITILPTAVVYTVKDEVAGKAVKILANMGFEAVVKASCAKIAVIGGGIAEVTGVMAQVIEALTNENIQVLQSADSNATIWVLVAKDNMVQAVRALHASFRLDR